MLIIITFSNSTFSSDNNNKVKMKGDSISKNIKVRDIEGKEFNLDSLFYQNPVVLVFYRGGWCPYCNLQLQNLRKIIPELKSLGTKLYAISPDTPMELKKSLDKHQINYTLLSDSKLAAAKEFNISFKVDGQTLEKYKKYKIDINKASGENHNLLPIPSVFIIDKQGNVVFKHSNKNYKVRLDEIKILSALKKLQK